MKQTIFGAHKAETFSLWAVLGPWLQLLAIYQSVGHAKIFSQKMNHNHHLIPQNEPHLTIHVLVSTSATIITIFASVIISSDTRAKIEITPTMMLRPSMMCRWNLLCNGRSWTCPAWREENFAAPSHSTLWVSLDWHSFPLSSIFSQYYFSPLSLTFHRPGRHHLCCLVALCFNRQVRMASPKYRSIEYWVLSIEYRVLSIDYRVLSIESKLSKILPIIMTRAGNGLDKYHQCQRLLLLNTPMTSRDKLCQL